MGAGTSGRLGVLDAAECPPTFGVSPDLIVGLIAGGEQAFIKAVEGAEDSRELGAEDLRSRHLTSKDLVVGIAASGRTPYVLGGLELARQEGCRTVAISCNANAEISQAADLAIEVVVGPEALTGSTRLKAGTAQKLILNMISTATMVGIGKVYQNLMVDVMQTNEKLHVRGENIVMEATGVDRETAKTPSPCQRQCENRHHHDPCQLRPGRSHPPSGAGPGTYPPGHYVNTAQPWNRGSILLLLQFRSGGTISQFPN